MIFDGVSSAATSSVRTPVARLAVHEMGHHVDRHCGGSDHRQRDGLCDGLGRFDHRKAWHRRGGREYSVEFARRCALFECVESGSHLRTARLSE